MLKGGHAKVERQVGGTVRAELCPLIDVLHSVLLVLIAVVFRCRAISTTISIGSRLTGVGAGNGEATRRLVLQLVGAALVKQLHGKAVRKDLPLGRLGGHGLRVGEDQRADVQVVLDQRLARKDAVRIGLVDQLLHVVVLVVH